MMHGLTKGSVVSLPVTTGTTSGRSCQRGSALLVRSSKSSGKDNLLGSECLSFDRRSTLLSFASAVSFFGWDLGPALAEGGEYETFYGTATPPTSYGGYGGNADEESKYKFEYPAGWKIAAPNKVEKGTQGIDCRVFNPRSKDQKITVVTFGRAGEDNKSFRLTDIETTIQGFAGADYDLQDAIADETRRESGERELDGEKYYDVEIESPDITYLITVTVKMGKVFALFVKSPTKVFKQDSTAFRHVVDTFSTL